VSFTCSASNRGRPNFETVDRLEVGGAYLAGRVRPDAESVEGSACRVINRHEPAIVSTNGESARVAVAKSAGHAVCQRRRDRTTLVLVDGRGRRASLAACCAAVDAAVLEFVMQSASRRAKILILQFLAVSSMGEKVRLYRAPKYE
jgi:hypothetical protein